MTFSVICMFMTKTSKKTPISKFPKMFHVMRTKEQILFNSQPGAKI